jgi:hypothetical protein
LEDGVSELVTIAAIAGATVFLCVLNLPRVLHAIREARCEHTFDEVRVFDKDISTVIPVSRRHFCTKCGYRRALG